MELKTKMSALALIAGSISTAMAAPSAFEVANCGPLNIINETSSTVVRDHKDCSKVWVMPPTTGTVTTVHFKKSGNLGFCSEMKNLQGFSKRIALKIDELTDRIDSQTPRIRAAERQVRIAEKNFARVSNNPITQEVMDLDSRIEEIDDIILGVTERMATCSTDCNVLRDEYNSLSQEKKALVSDLRVLRKKYRNELREFTKAQAQLEAANRHLDFVNEEVLTIASKQIKLKNQLNEMYATYGKLEGGYLGIDYNLGWEKNVVELEKKYPEFNFSQVPTKDARVHANFIGSVDKDTYLESLPMILDYSLAGLKYQPYGEEREHEISAVPGKLQGDLRLSVIGACPYNYSNFLADDSGDLVEREDLNNTEFGFGVSLSYKYPAVYKFALEAKYNLYKFYEKVVKSGSKGGFFSRRSWKKVSETKIDKEIFEIKWLDEAELYTREEKSEIKKAVKEELIARTLQNMYEPAGARPSSIGAVDSFNPEPGALVVARGLEKTCGWYSYKCQAASWILKGLTSIFGSSQAEARFRSTHDSTATEVWNEENVLWRPGASSFVE